MPIAEISLRSALKVQNLLQKIRRFTQFWTRSPTFLSTFLSIIHVLMTIKLNAECENFAQKCSERAEPSSENKTFYTILESLANIFIYYTCIVSKNKYFSSRRNNRSKNKYFSEKKIYYCSVHFWSAP